MKTYSFKVVMEPDEDAQGDPAWHAYCPALESVGGATSGRTREEALRNINEVVRMIVQEFIDEGRPLPEGPGDSVEIEEVSPEKPASLSRIDLTMDYRGLRSLTARELIAALDHDGFPSSDRQDLIGDTVTRVAGAPVGGVSLA
jgi:predicted RNase H-like HicB family nuclease